MCCCAETHCSASGAAGCWKGTPAEMFASLKKLAALPAETQVCCGHEYTEANARFAITVEPNNPDLQARAAEVKRLRAAGQPTVPSTIGSERAANPFLRAKDVATFADFVAARTASEGGASREALLFPDESLCAESDGVRHRARNSKIEST